jgi:hypothetical protein
MKNISTNMVKKPYSVKLALRRNNMNKISTLAILSKMQLMQFVAVFIIFCIPGALNAQPQETTAGAVKNCQFLEKIEGSSGYGKKFNWQSFAKSTVLTQAEKLGASHVVWERFNPVGAFNGIAVADVYSCNT